MMTKEKKKTELPQVMEGELRTRLIKLREDAGYDVSQMASVLCLSESVIVNLENEEFDLLPEPPYVRGYLRNYAKLGDDDSSELINRYESLRGADASELNFQIKTSSTISNKTQKRISPIWAQVIMLAILLGGIGLLSTIPEVKNWVAEKWESFSSQLEPSSAKNNPSLLGELPVPAPLPEDVATSPQQTSINTESNLSTQTQSATDIASQDSANTTQATTAENTSSENNSTDASNANSSAAETSTDATNEITNNTTDTNQTTTETIQETTSTDTNAEVIPIDPNAVINIKLIFSKEVWLRVKDKDNKTVFEGLNKAGTEKAIELMKPLTFRVGNAQGLSLFIDNKAVDISSYINGSIANFTLE